MTLFRGLRSPVRWVQSCITNVSFPTTLEDLEYMLAKNSHIRASAMDLELLLDPDPSDDLTWTAPRWIMEGDALFFYHAVMAPKRISHLLRLVRHAPVPNLTLTGVLERAAQLAGRYAGTIFGYAEVTGPTVFLSDEDEDFSYHFRSKVFAPLAGVHIFEHPLHARDFERYVMVSRGGTLTPVGASGFEGIKQLLAQNPHSAVSWKTK